MPIDFTFGFLTEKTEYDYTKEWERLGVTGFHTNSCNKEYKFILPISNHVLQGYCPKIITDDDDFIFYDRNKNLIKKYEDESIIFIEEYKSDLILKEIFQPFERLFVAQLKLDQTIFDIETWLISNLSAPFNFVLDISTERQVVGGHWEPDHDDDDDGYWVHGYSDLQISPSISFGDDTDAMAYKLKYL